MCGGGMHLESLLARCYLASSSSSLAVLPVRVPRKFDHIRRPFATLASPSSCLLLPVLALARPIPRNTGPKHRKLCNSLARSLAFPFSQAESRHTTTTPLYRKMADNASCLASFCLARKCQPAAAADGHKPTALRTLGEIDLP